MKKLLRTLLLTVLLTAALCVCALAAEPTKAGIYGIKPKENITVVPDTDGAEVEGYGTYYENAVKFTISDTGLTADKQYLLLVVKGTGADVTITADTIVYIDQAAAGTDGKIEFNAYPSALTKGSYSVYIIGEGKAFNAETPAATFSYHQPYTLGDVNDDGSINASDALSVLQHSAKLENLTGACLFAADVNSDGAVNASDALLILKYSAKLITSWSE